MEVRYRFCRTECDSFPAYQGSPSCYRTRWFITVIIKASHWIPSQAIWVQFTSLQHTYDPFYYYPDIYT